MLSIIVPIDWIIGRLSNVVLNVFAVVSLGPDADNLHWPRELEGNGFSLRR